MRDVSGWILRLFPELESFNERAARKQAWSTAVYEGVSRNPVFWVGALLCACVPTWVMSWSLITLGLQLIVWSIVLGTILGGILGMGPIFLFKARIQQSLRRQLLEAGVPVCMACGYCLRGLTNARCPECDKSTTGMENR